LLKVGKRRKQWEVFYGGTVSVWEDEKAVEVGGGDGCMTLWIHIMPLSRTLEMVKMYILGFVYFATIK
jgi:hypothetical protein